MKKNIFNKFIEILPLILLSLIPLLWYKFPDSLALGHDMGFPINPQDHFLDRLYSWTERMGLGDDQQLSLSAFFIHGLEALLSYLGFSIFNVQKITFILWMFLPFLSFYILIKYLHPEKKDWPLRISSSLLYGMNHFLLQAWSIAERTKFSIAVALPLVILWVVKYNEGKISAIKASFAIAITVFFFNGGGSPPLFGSILIFLAVSFVYYTVKGAGVLSFGKSLLKQMRFYLIMTVVFTLLNFYWIFPTVNSFLTYFSAEYSEVGGLEGILNWVDVISANTKLSNIIRLQGIPDWYDNVNHPYSQFFLRNKFMVLLGFVIPVLAFLSYLFAKKTKIKNYVKYFLLLAIFSLIFTSGSAGPLGKLYNVFIAKIPGFAIFRSPFYKFGLLLWLSFSYLIAFSVNAIYSFLKKRIGGKSIIFIVVFVIGYLFYNYPYFTGSFFNFMKKPYSTMVRVPDYVLNLNEAFKKYDQGRFLLLPRMDITNNADRYDWGYWSTTALVNLISDKPFLFDFFARTPNQKKLLENLYLASAKEDWGNFSFYANILGIKYVVIRNDFITDSHYGRPTEEKQGMEKSGIFKLVESVGKWDIYEFTNYKKMGIVSGLDLSILNKEAPDWGNNLNQTVDDYIYLDSNDKKDLEKIENLKESNVVLVSVCQGCRKEFYFQDKLSDLEVFRIGSPLFWFISKKENSILENTQSNFEKISVTSAFVLKRLRELEFLLSTNQGEVGKVETLLNLERNMLDRTTQLIGTMEGYNKTIDVENINRAYVSLKGARELSFLVLAGLADKGSTFNIIQNNITYIDKLIGLLKDKIWISDDQSLRYVFDNPVSGDYGFILDKEKLEEFIDFKLNDFKILLDNEDFTDRIVKKDSTIILENTFLEKGIHKVEIRGIKNRNLISDGYFFDIVSGKEKETCNELEIPNYDSFSEYKVAFKYKNVEGNPLWFRASLVTSDRTEFFRYLTDRMLPENDRDFTDVEINLDRESYQARAILDFCSQPKGKNESTNQIRDIKITKSSYPVLVVKENSEEIKVEDKIEATLEKVNQTKYRGTANIKQGGYLILTESFNQGWKLKITPCIDDSCIGLDKEKTKVVSEINHFLFKGYANSWKLEGNGKYLIEIYYLPQKVYLIGWIVSIISILFVMGILTKYENKNK